MVILVNKIIPKEGNVMSKIKRELYSQLKEQRGSIIGCYTYCKDDKSLSGKRVAIKNLDAFEDTYEDSKHNVGLRFVMSIDKEKSYDDIDVLETFTEYAELCDLDVLIPDEWAPLVASKGNNVGAKSVAVFVYPDNI